MMIRAVVFLAVVAVLGGCTSTASDPSRSGSPASNAQSPASASTESLIYSAVVRRLVTIDNTFAMSNGVSPFAYVYIVDGMAPRSPELSLKAEGAPFSDSLKREIMSRSSDLPPMEFVSTPEQKIDPDPHGATGVDNDGVIIGLGPIEHQTGHVVHVGAGFYCGNLCGHGLTYIVAKIDTQWQIEGTTGPRSVS